MLIVLGACNHKKQEIKGKPLLEVEGKFLYADEIQQVMPPNVNDSDSIQIADSYIRKWVTDVLMYENNHVDSFHKVLNSLVNPY